MTEKGPRVPAIVLAAGRGLRFGEGNKLLAELGGRALVRRVAEAALASLASETIVVTGHARAEVQAALAGLPTAFAHNPDFAAGLASSLRHGLAACGRCDGVLVLLGDMPRISASMIDALILAFAAAPHATAVVPACRGRRGNPALLSRALFPRLHALDGDEGARRLLEATAEIVEVPFDDEAIHADVDTPADLENLRAAFARS